MNALGIDYQQTTTVVSLREGASARLRSVGDGLRDLIPNAVRGQTMWGSRALLDANREDLRQGDAGNSGPWLDPDGAPIFWRQLYQRTRGYLGGLEPVPANGYRLVIGLQADPFPWAAKAISQLAKTAGFVDPICVPAPDALLCRWLAEGNAAGERIVAAVVVGDTAAAVRAYRLRVDERGQTTVTAVGPMCFLPNVGQADWMRQITTLVANRSGGKIPPEEELPVRDAAIEFGMQLGRAGDHESITWTGPLRERMVMPIQVTRAGILALLDIQAFNHNLAAALSSAMAGLKVTKPPDVILRGGSGAAWPFGLSALTQIVPAGKIWQSADPEHDVAYGTAWWPEVGEPYADVLHWKGLALQPPITPPPLSPAPMDSVGSPVSDLDQIPPWKRRSRLGQ